MSWILIPLIFYLPFSITTPIDQFDQIDSSPSFDGSAQEGANGGLTLQPGLDYSSLVASQIDLEPIGDTINNAGLSNPELSSDLPYFLADKSALPIDFGTPPETYVGRGAPTPLNPQIPLWDFGRYNGYPEKDSADLRDPMTLYGQYYKQPRFNCPTSGKTLYCCFPGEIMCEAYRERYPKCTPNQQTCCASLDFYANGLSCEQAISPANDEELNQWRIHQNSNYRMPGELGGSTGL